MRKAAAISLAAAQLVEDVCDVIGHSVYSRD